MYIVHEQGVFRICNTTLQLDFNFCVSGTKNVAKSLKKIMEGRVRDKGVTWFPELVDKRKCLFIYCDPFGKNVSKVTEITIQIMAERQQNFRYLKPLLY